MKKSSLERFEAKIERVSGGCWLWKGKLNGSGYGRMKFNGYEQRAHRVAYQLYNGPVAVGLFVLHKCDTPNCVNPVHLFLGTQTENLADMTAKNRRPTGEANGTAKLTWANVNYIRTSSKTCTAIAKELGVSLSLVARVRKGKIWKRPSLLPVNRRSSPILQSGNRSFGTSSGDEASS